mmetsp:Transcript_50233/g.56112  ORF Transcript_50233/g.56112 Transcript_50233/m.56112 type:complete len:186 (+) Transcript_50233:71-628(+)|eukprot:CAMPEP_0170803016 /NCGR_PEP_ID=MMETSP0733-20121128/29717_1 /TAXON_ID=186038 /ORGANISM="Fragilariopsis kerguelensis, Strain L26-C5" /LENGTH=185 /DNA_ID=CAMNT_0011156513 /DNA_START=47 /DNA_END=604 /DNA_ORIENTATION=-
MGYIVYKTYRAIILVLIIVIFTSDTFGFIVTSPLSTANQCRLSSPILRRMVDSSSVLVSTESWRQYVPLVVSIGVIVDILLGNPIANLALAPMKRQTQQENDSNSSSDTNDKNNIKRSKARIDADKVAQDALYKARNTLELRNFLEERKTDYDRMEEMKRNLDISMQDLDEDMEKRQKSLDEKKQ